MFGSILIFIVALLSVYVFWRAAAVPLVRRHIPRKRVMGLAVILWAGFVLALVLGHRGAGALSAPLELLGMTWLAALFLMSACLLVADLVTCFGLVLPRLAPSLRGWALAVGVGLSVVALVQGLRPPSVQSHTVHLDELPAKLDGTVLVAMSDLHLGSLLGPRWLEARVRQVEALHPDLIVLLGDIIEGHGGAEADVLAGLSRLSAPLGVWAVSGNHESYGGGDRASLLGKETSIEMLRNRWVQVRPGLVLAGVDDLTAAARAGRKTQAVARALAGRPPGATILLSHTPWQTERAARDGADLMLCGHTHGGQIWPFSYLVRIRYPLLAGRYDVGNMPVIVSRGVGTWGPRMRLWHRGEILRITLRSRSISTER